MKIIESSHKREWSHWIEDDDGNTVGAVCNNEHARAIVPIIRHAAKMLDVCECLLSALQVDGKVCECIDPTLDAGRCLYCWAQQAIDEAGHAWRLSIEDNHGSDE